MLSAFIEMKAVTRLPLKAESRCGTGLDHSKTVPFLGSVITSSFISKLLQNKKLSFNKNGEGMATSKARCYQVKLSEMSPQISLFDDISFI